jgi:hypothetical protein
MECVIPVHSVIVIKAIPSIPQENSALQYVRVDVAEMEIAHCQANVVARKDSGFLDLNYVNRYVPETADMENVPNMADVNANPDTN